METDGQAALRILGGLMEFGFFVYAFFWMIVVASRLNRIGQNMTLFHGDVARFLSLELDRLYPKPPQGQPSQTDRPQG